MDIWIFEWIFYEDTPSNYTEVKHFTPTFLLKII